MYVLLRYRRMALVGKEPKDHLVPTLLSCAGTPAKNQAPQSPTWPGLEWGSDSWSGHPAPGPHQPHRRNSCPISHPDPLSVSVMPFHLSCHSRPLETVRCCSQKEANWRSKGCRFISAEELSQMFTQSQTHQIKLQHYSNYLCIEVQSTGWTQGKKWAQTGLKRKVPSSHLSQVLRRQPWTSRKRCDWGVTPCFAGGRKLGKARVNFKMSGLWGISVYHCMINLKRKKELFLK